VVTLRLKVDNRKISEAEWVISRKGDPGLNGPAGGNGVTMAGRGAAPRGGGGPGTVRDCTSGLETINIQNVAARRFPVVDEEAGVVLAMAVFIRKPGTTTRRNMFGEWFFLENHKIRTIYATLFYPPPEMPVPNWPPYDGNWPLPASLNNGASR